MARHKSKPKRKESTTDESHDETVSAINSAPAAPAPSSTNTDTEPSAPVATAAPETNIPATAAPETTEPATAATEAQTQAQAEVRPTDAAPAPSLLRRIIRWIPIVGRYV